MMKTSIKSIAAAFVLTAFFVAPASAMVIQGDLSRDISSAVGGGSNVTATVAGDTVTLSGYFADAGDKLAAIRAAQNSAGVERVVNNAFQSN